MTNTKSVALLLFAAVLAGCTEREAEARGKRVGETPTGSALTDIDGWATMKWDEFASAMDQKLQQADRRIEELKSEIASKGRDADFSSAQSKWAQWRQDLREKLEKYRSAGASAAADMKADIHRAWVELRGELEAASAKLRM
jgi:hypothetical protein